MPSIQQKKQVIDSLIQNFNWETNPNWQEMMVHIDEKIIDYWDNSLERKFNRVYGKKD